MIICWKQHLLTTLTRTDRVTDMKADELCINRHYWASPLLLKHSLLGAWFQRVLSEPQTVLHGLIPPLYLIQTPVTKIRWSVNAAKCAYVTSVWTSDADRDTRLASSPPSPKTSKGIWRFVFSPSKQKCCFVIVLVSVKRVGQRHETHFLLRAAHTSLVTSNHIRQQPGGQEVKKEEDGWLWIMVCRAAINVANSHYRKTHTPTGKNPLG